MLILCLGCRTANYNAEAEKNAALSLLTPPRPAAPETEAVIFEGRDGGLWLGYEQYRALERNITALREYTAKLEAVLDFYEGGYHAD